MSPNGAGEATCAIDPRGHALAGSTHPGQVRRTALDQAAPDASPIARRAGLGARSTAQVPAATTNARYEPFVDAREAPARCEHAPTGSR